MAGRIRSIKPEWLEDEKMAMASSDARVLSIALILIADDYGNGRCCKANLSGRVFPPSGDSPEDLLRSYERFSEALKEVLSMGFAGTYTVAGQTYFSIRKWDEHQKVNHPGKPLVPNPPENLWNVSRESLESLLPDLRPTTNDQRPGGDLRASEPARTREAQPLPPPSVTRVRSEARPANAEAQPGQGQPIAPQPAHSEPPRPIPPSEPKCVPLATRRVRATDDLMTCPVGELAKRCRLNQHDAGVAPLGERPELVRVNEAWARAVGLQVRPLGSYGDRNRPLTALLEAFEVATEDELLRACEAAARDDWCCGRKGSDRDQARKRDIGCLSQTVLRRLLDAAAEARPTNINPRVAAMLAEEERRRSGT